MVAQKKAGSDAIAEAIDLKMLADDVQDVLRVVPVPPGPTCPKNDSLFS